MSDLNAGNLRKIRKTFTGLGFMPAGLDPRMGELTRHIAETARHLAPVDEGELRDSIEVEAPGELNPYSGSENRTWAVVVNCDHAAAVEYGTHEMVARPYFRPAIAMAKAGGTIRAFVNNAIAMAIIKLRRP